jgi:ankyrin repeat protein
MLWWPVSTERTALHLACRWGRTDVCVALLAAGATLDRVDDKVTNSLT